MTAAQPWLVDDDEEVALCAECDKPLANCCDEVCSDCETRCEDCGGDGHIFIRQNYIIGDVVSRPCHECAGTGVRP